MNVVMTGGGRFRGGAGHGRADAVRQARGWTSCWPWPATASPGWSGCSAAPSRRARTRASPSDRGGALRRAGPGHGQRRPRPGRWPPSSAACPIASRSLAEFPGVVLPPGGRDSYTENALGKARAVTAATGLLALADDSGIEVDALDGRPGVLSARYGGEELSELERNALHAARSSTGCRPSRRTARYRCDRGDRAGWPRGHMEGTVEGLLLEAPRGAGGFGYDPLFYHPPLGATFAEISPSQERGQSSRSRRWSGAPASDRPERAAGPRPFRAAVTRSGVEALGHGAGRGESVAVY